MLLTDVDLDIYVTRVEQGEVTNIIHGYALVKSHRIEFDAVAFGRFGGQNISLKLDNTAESTLVEMELEIAEFEQTLQQKLVEGDITVVSEESSN